MEKSFDVKHLLKTNLRIKKFKKKIVIDDSDFAIYTNTSVTH